MVYDKDTVRILYKKLLNLYPRGFRDQMGESMEQTFNDLFKERQREGGWSAFLFWMFIETGLGAFREHILIITHGDSMKTLISNPTSAAITSMILSLPLGLTFVAFMFDIEPLTKVLNNLFTIDGQQINMLGRMVIYGGLLLLPIAFVLNLRPMWRTQGPEGKRRLYLINLIIGIGILLLITFTWGGLILEEIYCLQGIRCD